MLFAEVLRALLIATFAAFGLAWGLWFLPFSPNAAVAECCATPMLNIELACGWIGVSGVAPDHLSVDSA